MPYTLTIQEILERPIIRDDQIEEWQNKMTDDELLQWDREVYASIQESGELDWNIAYMNRVVDRTILYKLFKQDSSEANQIY